MLEKILRPSIAAHIIIRDYLSRKKYKYSFVRSMLLVKSLSSTLNFQ